MEKEVIAFDIGGTNTRCALVVKNKIKKFVSVKTPKNKEKFLKQICSFIDEFLSKKTIGVGIAFPGLIENGIIRNAPNLGIKNLNLKQYLKNKYKIPVEVYNDAGCVAIAESRLGTKKKNFFVMTLGTGIGGGIMVDSKPYRGLGEGAEFGHMYVRGVEFESLWKKSKRKIISRYGENILIKNLVKRKNDKKAKEILEEASDYLGEGIASLISALDPEIVVVAGGLKESGPVFIKMIEKKVNEYAFIKRKIPVKWSKLKEPGILGASLLVK
jgi:glucokinase